MTEESVEPIPITAEADPTFPDLEEDCWGQEEVKSEDICDDIKEEEEGNDSDFNVESEPVVSSDNEQSDQVSYCSIYALVLILWRLEWEGYEKIARYIVD